MSYAPFIHPGEIASQANPFARSPSINSLFNRCYGSDILPSRAQFPRSFQHEDVFANLYLSDRQWVDEVDFAPDDTRRATRALSRRALLEPRRQRTR